MPSFKHIEVIDGAWLSGRLEPETVTVRVPNLPDAIETKIIFKADLKDVQELDAEQIDEMIAELQNIKAKLFEMDVEVNPPPLLPLTPIGPPSRVINP